MTDFDKTMDYEKEQKKIERPFVSPAVIRRLPRYFRYLRELLREGKHVSAQVNFPLACRLRLHKSVRI